MMVIQAVKFTALAFVTGCCMGLLVPAVGFSADPATTSTEWRDDVANLEVVAKINEAYRQMPFSREYEGVLDECPLRLEWSVGPNLPVCWKGGAAGVIGDEIVMSGGLWMPDRLNLAYAFNTQTHK